MAELVFRAMGEIWLEVPIRGHGSESRMRRVSNGAASPPFPLILAEISEGVPWAFDVPNVVESTCSSSKAARMEVGTSWISRFLWKQMKEDPTWLWNGPNAESPPI